MSDINESISKEQILKDILKELHFAKLNLLHEKDVEVSFAKNHITIAIKLILGEDL